MPESLAADLDAECSACLMGARRLGELFDRYGREVRTSRQSRNPATRERLWTLSEELTGVTFDLP